MQEKRTTSGTFIAPLNCITRYQSLVTRYRATVVSFARKSRPFEFKGSVVLDKQSEEEILTEKYLASLGTDTWKDDPPGHKSGYIAVVGCPNAGKSTLVNALVGQKLSIVTAKAQTTRHRILSLLNEDKFQMILLDTPGLMTTQRNKLDEKMMKSVWQSTREADAIFVLVDASFEAKELTDSMRQLFEAKEGRKLRLALVLNKIDLISHLEQEALMDWFRNEVKADVILPISAKLGTGLGKLKEWALEQLSEGPSLYPKDTVSEEPERFFIAEIVREQIFKQYQQEIPYSSTAEVTEYAERPGAKDLVRVSVTVESDSQKGIIIGKGGTALKRLSTAAREDIEEFVGKSVYLDISIKVNKGWRSDEATVTKLGY